jgi:tetratricopeptide (TPR) repeat protein
MKEKKFEQALKAFAQALNLGKEGNTINALPTTFLNTYLALLYTKQLNKAIYFESIMPINGLTPFDRSTFYFMKANRLVANKELVPARKEYKLAIKFNPRNLNAKANLAALYIVTGNKQQGLLMLNQVLTISPEHKMALMYKQKYQ